MDAQFQATAYLVINQFLQNVSDRCDVQKDGLWKLWKEMFNDFPKEPIVKKVSKKKEVKPVESKQIGSTPSIKDVPVPVPVVEKSVPIVETSIPVVETSVPIVETSVPVVETSIPIVETSVPVVETSIPVVETSIPVVETSVPVVPETSVSSFVEQTDVKKEKKTKVLADGCQYIMIRGDRVGQECGKKKKGDQFCATHTK